MKVILILVGMGVAVVHTSYISDDAQVTTKNKEYDVTIASALEDGTRLRPIFPKSAQKFKNTRTKNVTTPMNTRRLSKKPVFKIVQRAVNMNNKNNWKMAATRPSLMKYKKFTINPLTTFNTRTYSVRRNEQNDQDEDGGESSEEVTETSIAKNKNEDKTKYVKILTRRPHKLGSRITKEKHVENEGGRFDKIEAEVSSEEKEDREEYIFVIPKKIKNHPAGAADSSRESGESTTLVLDKELKLRHERSINVIEEENLGSTVSGFKFTGKGSSLGSDLVFRNIHT